MEIGGYGKPNMTEDEVKQERRMFEKEIYSLDFMLDDADLQEEQEVIDIILRELKKDKEQKVQDHIELEGNLRLYCKNKNGYMQAAFHLLSRSNVFVRYFLSSKYLLAEGNVPKTQHISLLLDNLFSQMWRPILQIKNDRQIVDISGMMTQFYTSFSPFESHDAYAFLAHILAGVTRETVDHDAVEAWRKAKKNSDIYKYFGKGVINHCFGILFGT